MTLWIAAWLATFGAPPEGGEFLQPGDRVVLVGDTLIERAQRYGYLETGLVSRHPGSPIVFRNVGWSGDTTTGLSRAYFDPPAEGKRRLLEHIRDNKPTVLIFGYGMSESFAGEAGLKTFRTHFNQLLDETATQVRHVALASPIRQEQPHPELPDPQDRNQELQRYSDAIRELAASRDYTFLDLFQAFSEPNKPVDLTDNGIHLTQVGYWFWSLEVQRLLGLQSLSAEVELGRAGKVVRASHAAVSKRTQSGGTLQFSVAVDRLPTPIPENLPEELASHPLAAAFVLKVSHLEEGEYSLRVNGKVLHTADAAAWNKGVRLRNTPLHDQAESLRQTILRKNHLYFQQFRPQNITYLLGFRRYEQGQNAQEIEKLGDFIAEAEREILELSRPKAVTFELAPAADN